MKIVFTLNKHYINEVEDRLQLMTKPLTNGSQRSHLFYSLTRAKSFFFFKTYIYNIDVKLECSNKNLIKT